MKLDLLAELERIKKSEKTVAAYGAAAKGNTLLNFVGLKSDSIEYVVDRNPHKQGKYLPGSNIPIVSEEYLQNNPPDVLLITLESCCWIKSTVGIFEKSGREIFAGNTQFGIFLEWS